MATEGVPVDAVKQTSQKPQGDGPRLMTQLEYSKHRKTSKQYINKLVKADVLVMVDDKIDVDASDRVLADKAEEDEDLGPNPSYGQARTNEMIWRARLRRLEYEAKQGTLIDADSVRLRLSEHMRTLRDNLLGLPDRLSSTLAAEGDARKVHVALKGEISRELDALARNIGNI